MVLEFLNRRAGGVGNRIPDRHSDGRRGGLCLPGHSGRSAKNGPRRHGHNRDKYNRELGYGLVEFLIIFVVLAYLTFAATDAAIVLVQHQAAKHLIKQCADFVRYEGRLSVADESTIRGRFNDVGLPIESLDTQKESEGELRVLRSTNGPSSTIEITIVSKPERKPFTVGRLIGGIQVGDSWRIRVYTKVFSERVDP